jgi:hypothetical protein
MRTKTLFYLKAEPARVNVYMENYPAHLPEVFGSHEAGRRLGGPTQFSYKRKMKFSRKYY